MACFPGICTDAPWCSDYTSFLTMSCQTTSGPTWQKSYPSQEKSPGSSANTPRKRSTPSPSCGHHLRTTGWNEMGAAQRDQDSKVFFFDVRHTTKATHCSIYTTLDSMSLHQRPFMMLSKRTAQIKRVKPVCVESLLSYDTATQALVYPPWHCFLSAMLPLTVDLNHLAAFRDVWLRNPRSCGVHEDKRIKWSHQASKIMYMSR